MKVIRSLLFLAALGACKDATPSDLSMEFKETPFRHLRGVELGMTGRQLRAARPAAKYAPYMGLQERIPGYTVTYQFPVAAVANDDAGANVGDLDKLEAIFITEGFVSMEDAQRSWHGKVREVSAAHRAPDACETFPTGGMQARWFSGGMVLAIGVFPREPIARAVGDRVLYALAPLATMKQPAGATKVACPNS